MTQEESRSAGTIFFEELREVVQELERSLGKDEFLTVIHTQSGELIRVEMVAYDANMLKIYGSDAAGQRACVVAHINSAQLVFKIRKVPESQPEPQPERRPIGFRMTPSTNATEA